jgi:hypothetical protein
MSEPTAGTGSIYQNLPDNSHKGRAEAKVADTVSDGKRVEKIVRGKVRTKKNEVRRFTDVFLAEDISNVKEYIIFDILAPIIKRGFYDLIVSSLDITLFGGRGQNGKRPTADKVSYRDYNSMSRRDDRGSSSRTTSGYSYDDIILETRGEAEAVLSRLDEIMEEYQIVRVADLYDLVGITGEHTDNKYGWTNIRNAEIERLRDGGYRIKMPRALPIR